MSERLRASIDAVVRAIPEGKKGQATVAVTMRGAQAEVGYKPKPWFYIGGYGEKLWGGGWEAGAKATATW